MMSIRSDMQNDMKDLINPLQDSINMLLEINKQWEHSLKECNELKQQNLELNTKMCKIENDNKLLNQRVQQLEDKLLEGNVMFQGIPDSLWEPSETTKEKVFSAIAHTISGDKEESKMDQAWKIPIKDVTRLGHYTAMRNGSVLVEFHYKSDAAFLISNRTHLPKGVYVDKQYSAETEKEHRKLLPIL